MKLFAQMIKRVDETNKTNAKLQAMADYFNEADSRDKIWAIALLSHRRPRRPVNTTLLRAWAAELAGIELWLFEESYYIVGDLAETIALLSTHENSAHPSRNSLSDYIELIIALKDKPEEEKKKIIMSVWAELDFYTCFVFNKLITGGFRIGISRKLMTKALSMSTGIDAKLLAHRIMGNWDPATADFDDIILAEGRRDDHTVPYPFYLAYSIEGDHPELGDPSQWLAEWKWDGIRGQLIKRKGDLLLWSRGEELVTDKYPEIHALSHLIPDGIVIDGEILPFENELPLDFRQLQKRIGRKTISPKLLRDIPVIFMAYDLLEFKGKDIRHSPFAERRKILERIVSRINSPRLMISPLVEFRDWEKLGRIREESRARRVEGFMLKKKDSVYRQGRVKGEMWKWKVEPYTVDAVLTYATRGHGRRANLYTDYTFGLWKEGELVTFAKAYSGLTDEEFVEVDRFVRRNTLDRFGPVRQVKPQLVFELAFEGIARSGRHKSGVATRFPRIKRWRRDKKPEEANSIEDILALIID